MGRKRKTKEPDMEQGSETEDESQLKKKRITRDKKKSFRDLGKTRRRPSQVFFFI